VLAAATVQSVRSRTRAGRDLIGEPGRSRAPEHYAVQPVPSQACRGKRVAQQRNGCAVRTARLTQATLFRMSGAMRKPGRAGKPSGKGGGLGREGLGTGDRLLVPRIEQYAHNNDDYTDVDATVDYLRCDPGVAARAGARARYDTATYGRWPASRTLGRLSVPGGDGGGGGGGALAGWCDAADGRRVPVE
jgi:hypothetical protein